MWDLKEHNNSGAIIRTCQNLFILAEFLTFWHALETFIGNKKESYTYPLFMIIISVTVSLFLVMCEVRSKWCVLCWPHASTSAPDAQIWPGKFANPSKAKQSSLGSTSQAEPGERPGLVTATGQIVDQSRGLWLVNWAVLGCWLADTGQALAAEIEKITPSHTSQPASPSVLWWNTSQYLISNT